MTNFIRYNKIMLLFFFIFLLFYNFIIRGISLWILIPSMVLIIYLIYQVRHFTIILAMRISVIICFIITILILFSISYEAFVFFTKISLVEFLFGIKWKAYPYIKNDIIFDNVFGIIPLLLGTLMISSIAVLIALPISMITSMYMSIYMSKKVRYFAQIMINVMAGIPTVVYGYFAINHFINPINTIFQKTGFKIMPDNALTTGIAMSFMLIPTIVSLVNNVISNTPKNIVYGSLALGSTKLESFIKIILPSCYSGIFSAILISISRALGETMIVVMLASLTPNISFNPLNFFTTITIQITTILTGDQGFTTIETSSAYALSLYLFTITLIINIFAVTTFNKYKRKNEVYQ